MTGAQYKKIYHDRKARGVCTACGLRKPRQGVLTCRECAIKSRKATTDAQNGFAQISTSSA